jgi:hypothetical protein
MNTRTLSRARAHSLSHTHAHAITGAAAQPQCAASAGSDGTPSEAAAIVAGSEVSPLTSMLGRSAGAGGGGGVGGGDEALPSAESLGVYILKSSLYTGFI